ncbi:MAG: twin-arginine translocation pathway signal protein [Sulfurospirillum sp.]|nr:twin-arginine translocation pathway signal protein [Sulfurospirillum sp.]
MKRRDAIKIAAMAALAITSVNAYDAKLITNTKDMLVKDPTNPTDFELKHSPEITVSQADAKGFVLVEVNIGQKSVIHPSVANHWIYEIELFGDDKKIATVALEPVTSRGYLAARVDTKNIKQLTAVSKCNLHGIFTTTRSI